MNYMIFVYVGSVWLVLMIAYNIWTGKKEKEKNYISKGGMRKYNKEPMKMSIGEILKRKDKIKHFNGRFKW